MSVRPHLLYISPVLPAMTSNGLAIREGMVLRTLASRHDLSLLVEHERHENRGHEVQQHGAAPEAWRT